MHCLHPLQPSLTFLHQESFYFSHIFNMRFVFLVGNKQRLPQMCCSCQRVLSMGCVQFQEAFLEGSCIKPSLASWERELRIADTPWEPVSERLCVCCHVPPPGSGLLKRVQTAVSPCPELRFCSPLWVRSAQTYIITSVVAVATASTKDVRNASKHSFIIVERWLPVTVQQHCYVTVLHCQA